jgi:hypothetical protein
VLANADALGGGSVLSNNGLLGVEEGTTLSSLTVNGPVTIVSDIRTTNSQRYGGAVTFASGSAVSPMQMTSENADISFLSTLNSDAANRSLNLDALLGKVSFSDTLGYLAPSGAPKGPSINNLRVNANDILLMGDIYTLNTQTYNGAVVISNNGSNGLLRTFISQDPSIVFLSTVDDSSAVTHTLDVRAISFDPLLIPEIKFMGAVGSIVPLGGLLVTTEMRIIPADPRDPITIVPAGTLTIADNINTVGEQRFSSGSVTLDPAPGRTISLTSERSTVQFAGISEQDQNRLIGQINIVNNSNLNPNPVAPQPDSFDASSVIPRPSPPIASPVLPGPDAPILGPVASSPDSPKISLATPRPDSLATTLNYTPLLEKNSNAFYLPNRAKVASVSVGIQEQVITCKIEANDECD